MPRNIVHIRYFRRTGTVAFMNLVEWLRTPRYLRTRFMMETRPLNRLELEIVFLEVAARDALVRLPVAFMLLPKAPRPWRDQQSDPGQDK